MYKVGDSVLVRAIICEVVKDVVSLRPFNGDKHWLFISKSDLVEQKEPSAEKCGCEKPFNEVDFHKISYCIKCGKDIKPQAKIEPLKGDWVTESQALSKVCAKVDEICNHLNKE